MIFKADSHEIYSLTGKYQVLDNPLLFCGFLALIQKQDECQHHCLLIKAGLGSRDVQAFSSIVLGDHIVRNSDQFKGNKKD